MPKKIYKLKTESTNSFNLTIPYEKELNKEQFDVVTHADGPCLVLAGAGSGKTRTLIYRLAYLLETGVKPEQILLMTFTNKAAKEMVSRSESLLGSYPKGLWAGTFHHVGNRLLRMYSKHLDISPTYTIMDESDAVDLINNITGELVTKKNKYFPKGKVIKNIISFATNAGISINTAIEAKFDYIDDEVTGTIALIGEKYRERKYANNTLDYDDLLVLWLKLLTEYPEVRNKITNRFRYIMVDEYQDTNHIQASLIREMAMSHQNILVVGDDAQSIYSFRAADVANILSFPDIFPNTRVFKLETNYRSTPEILALANQSITHNTSQFTKELHATLPTGDKPVVAAVNNIEEQAEFIVQRVLELNDEGISLNDIAVLFRADYQALELELALNKKNIPYIKRGGVRFFEQAHLKDIVSFLKILHNPSDVIAWTRILLLFPGIGKTSAARITSTLTNKTHEAIFAESYGLSTKALASWRTLTTLLQKTLEKLATQEKISTIIDVIITDFYENHARTSFDNATDRLDDIGQLGNFTDSYPTLAELLSDITLAEQFNKEKPNAEPSNYDEQLVLSTIHQAKGLEWHTVFVLQLASGQFPHAKSMNNRAQFEEERRLFYVSVTRAKQQLYLLYPITIYSHANGLTFANPSEFIRELDQSLYDEWSIESSRISNDDLPTIEYLPEV